MAPNFEDLRRELRAVSGTTLIADLGVVDHGKIGYSDCTVSAGIEYWQELYFVWISVRHQKNRSGSYTRVIKWPYSRTSDKDLDRVVADLMVIENVTASGKLPDNRGWFARMFDKLIGCEHLGAYRFTSPVENEALYGGKVLASVVKWRNQVEISLTEGRQAGVVILAQFPQKACGAIREALIEYMQR